MSPLARRLGQILFTALAALGLLLGTAISTSEHIAAPFEAAAAVESAAPEPLLGLGAIHHALDHAQATGTFPAGQYLPPGTPKPAWVLAEMAIRIVRRSSGQERPPKVGLA